MEKLHKTELNNYIKSNVSKTQLQANIQKFTTCNQSLRDIFRGNFDMDDVTSVLEMLKDGCSQMTSTYCRLLWFKGRELGYIRDEICEQCGLNTVCVQLKSNQVEGKLYYNICMVWQELLRIKEKGYIKQSDMDVVKLIADNIENFKDELTTFNSFVSGW